MNDLSPRTSELRYHTILRLNQICNLLTASQPLHRKGRQHPQYTNDEHDLDEREADLPVHQNAELICQIGMKMPIARTRTSRPMKPIMIGSM